MKFSVFFRLVLFSICIFFLSGCYFAIPTIAEAVNQNRLQAESEGAVLESKTGALKLIANNPAITTNKLNAYIQGYNSIMVGSLSLLPSYHTFTTLTLKSRSTDTISFPIVDGLEKGIAWLKKGMSYSHVSIPELDEVVATSIVAGEKLDTDEQRSLPYFRSQMYRRDDMVGARQIFPVLQKDYDNMIAAMNRMGAILMQLQKEETERQMAVARSKKSMIGYNTEKSLLHAQELVMLFSDAKNGVTNKEKYGEGDKIVLEMKTALSAQRKIMDDVYPLRSKNDKFDRIHDYLIAMITQYQNLKRKKDPRSFNRMIKQYSNAIESYNQSIKRT